MENYKSKVSDKVSKGYRLRNSTHKLIERVQLIMNESKDSVISKAMKMYHSQIINAISRSKKHHKKY